MEQGTRQVLKAGCRADFRVRTEAGGEAGARGMGKGVLKIRLAGRV